MIAPSPTPADYRRWRGTTLGSVTERVERDLVFELAGPVGGKRVLDVGCGDGTYAIAAAARGARVTAADTAAPMLEAARRRAADHHMELELARADVADLPFDDESFDAVLGVTVLCFVSDAAGALREMARVLVPGGRLVVGELNRWSSWAAWRRVRGRLGSGTWRGARFLTPRQLVRLVQAAGLEVERVADAVHYPPSGLAAAALERLERLPRTVTTLGAAFIAVSASKPSRQLHEGSAR